MPPLRRALRRLARPLTAALVVTAAPACIPTIRHLGRTPAEATAHADTLLGALEARFGPHDLGTVLQTIRPRLVQGALVPSRVFDDSAVWTEMDGRVRRLELAGNRTSDGYRIVVSRDASLPARPAEYHRTVLLKQLHRDEYEWRVHDALAVGAVRAEQLAQALTMLYSTAERENATAVRADYRRVLPRTTEALGRLFSLDTIALRPSARGATAVRLGLTMHPDRLDDGFPRFARFLDRFASPAHLRIEVYDDAGSWWKVTGDEGHFTVTMRVRDGSLVPLDGAPRPMPARLHVRMKADTKMFVFRIGFHDLVGDVLLTRTEHQKGFVAIFQHEPEWVLPPLVATMIRTSLRRPFAGTGALLSFDVRDDVGGETLALRDYRLAIEESALMRWLGGLGDSAISDFRQGAEADMDRFIGETFAALARDVEALAQRQGVE